MFTNNKFAKMDSIANLVKTILETDTKAKMEELKGNQHKIDKNKNNRIDAQDFEILRGQKKGIKKEEVVAEGRMPSSVIKNKKRLADMPDIEFAELHKNKSDDELRDMARRHGYGQNSTYYVDKRNTGMKEEFEQVDEASHQAKTTMKHITNPTAGEKKAAKDIKPGVAGYRDRIAMLKSAEARGALKKEESEQVDEASAPPVFQSSYGLNRNKDATKKTATATISGKKMQGKGYDDPENERKAPEGNVPVTSLMPGHDERAAKFLARQAKGKLVKGKAQSAPQKEEVEQVDESGLGSEFDKFVADRNANRKPGQPKMTPRTAQSVIKPGGPKTPEDALKNLTQNIPLPRDVGYPKRKMNERELSEPETAEKERIVKGMKKNLAGFKARYGERAKSVMYATATKKAKENK